MKNAKKTLVIISVCLFILQVLSFSGMSKVQVGLYPDNDDFLYPRSPSSSSGLNAKMALFAIDAGIDRFISGLEDLSYEKYDYRVMTSTQMASAMIRESLDCSSGGSVGLVVYDTILTISYSFPSIIGGILLFISSKVKKQEGEEKTVA